MHYNGQVIKSKMLKCFFISIDSNNFCSGFNFIHNHSYFLLSKRKDPKNC